jgi:hypothetical protein
MKKILFIILSSVTLNVNAQKKINWQVFAELNAVGLKGIYNSFDYYDYRIIDTPTNRACRYNNRNESKRDAVIRPGGVLGIKFNYSISKNFSAYIGTSLNAFSMEYNHTNRYYTVDSTFLTLRRIDNLPNNYSWFDEERNMPATGNIVISSINIIPYATDHKIQKKEVVKFITLSFPVGMSYKFKNSKIIVNGEVCPMLKLSYSSSAIPKRSSGGNTGYSTTTVNPLFNGNKPQSLIQFGAGVSYAVTKKIDLGIKFNHFTSNVKTVSTNEKLRFNMIGLQFHYLIKPQNDK